MGVESLPNRRMCAQNQLMKSLISRVRCRQRSIAAVMMSTYVYAFSDVRRYREHNEPFRSVEIYVYEKYIDNGGDEQCSGTERTDLLQSASSSSLVQR